METKNLSKEHSLSSLKNNEIPVLSDNYNTLPFSEENVLNELKRYLPAQAPLKDFIFQNTLASFQHLKFFHALEHGTEMFGYKTSLSIDEYRALYSNNKIREEILDKIISDKKGKNNLNVWKEKALTHKYTRASGPRIGQLRSNWKKIYKIDLDSRVHTLLFRILCSYLDQGISIWNFPVWQNGFLPSIKEMEKNSYTSFFKTDRARKLLRSEELCIEKLLHIIVGDPSLYKQYLFDQQFSHQGWSGMVSVIEQRPETLMDTRKISLHDLIILELLLEIDVLESTFGKNWQSLSTKLPERPKDLFAEVQFTEMTEVLSIFQEAYEYSYYDEVLHAIQVERKLPKQGEGKSFQAMFCIDDRETSLRDYLEKTDRNCYTYGTPGFFNVEFYFQPQFGKAYTKLCPAPVTPKYLIKEEGGKDKREKDLHMTKNSHSLFFGWLISQTLGFWAAFRLALNIFRPSMTAAVASSFKHMDAVAKLTIENKNTADIENGLQVGFTIEEMTNRVEALLKSIGLVNEFAPIVYVCGHGASSVNNPYYATMDCGACSCRPGSVNARSLSFMANHSKVREGLRSRGIDIPETTQFIGGLHDTTRDEVMFYDENSLSPDNQIRHQENLKVFYKALDLNSKERSRRFESVDTNETPEVIHEKILKRSVSLFEPRPELDHANNALTIVGRRELSKGLFLDRRSFMNSYDYRIDPEGKYLFNILKAAAPVCGGINLGYYFSRVDNQKLGAGTKLPHNVMGLIGVANGIEGDLRPGLPSQMIESHDPLRQLFIVEHYPEVVLDTIKRNSETYEWFINEWVHLVVFHPETKELHEFREGLFVPYKPLRSYVNKTADMTPIIENIHCKESIPVYIITE